jgi:hypothetical protein
VSKKVGPVGRVWIEWFFNIFVKVVKINLELGVEEEQFASKENCSGVANESTIRVRVVVNEACRILSFDHTEYGVGRTAIGISTDDSDDAAVSLTVGMVDQLHKKIVDFKCSFMIHDLFCN